MNCLSCSAETDVGFKVPGFEGFVVPLCLAHLGVAHSRCNCGKPGELMLEIPGGRDLWLCEEHRRGVLATVRSRPGPRLRRTLLPRPVEERILAERFEVGRTLQEIADGLMADSIPTAMGNNRWYPSTVRQIIERLTAVEPVETSSAT